MMTLGALALVLLGFKQLPSTSASPLLQNVPGTTNIVGGDQADEGEFPFYVDVTGGCGGSLIYEDIVMSAAHCDGDDWADVYVGAFRKASDDYGAERRYVIDKSVHPYYDDYSLENDVMVVKLDQPSTITPIPLNDNNTLLSAGDELITIGLGCTIGNTSSCKGYPDYLRKTRVSYYSYEECDAIHWDIYGKDYIYRDVTLCAGTEEGGPDHCYGDSGGPIMKQMDDGSYVQVGVTSWTWSCGAADVPSVYTRISGVKDWLDSQICALSENPPADCPTPAPVPPPSNPEFPELEFPWG